MIQLSSFLETFFFAVGCISFGVLLSLIHRGSGS